MRHSACCFSSERLFNSLSLPPNTLPLQSALFSFRILPLKPAHSPVSVTGLLLKPPHLPAEHQISQRNILSFISSLIPNLIPHPIPCLIPNLQQRRSAAIHVRQPCPPTMSAKILRVHIAPPSNVQFVRSSMRLSCHLPPASSSMPLSIPPSVPLPMPLLRRHPFCRLAYTVLFIVHAIRVPSCKPGFKHGRPPCPRCRRLLLVSLCFTIVSHPFSASYGHMTSRTGLTWSI